MSWPRKVGVALALLLLGASAVLAGQALEQAGHAEPPGTTPQPSVAALPGPPVLLEPGNALVATATTNLEVSLPAGLRPRQGYRLRIYVNDELVHEGRLRRESPATIEGIPLERGENRVSAAVAGPGGESLHSNQLLIVRDDQPPSIHIIAPATGEELFTRSVTLRGRTKPGSQLTIRNTTNGESHELEVGEDGRFEQRLTLAMGSNVISLRTRDAAGNRSRASLHLTRLQSLASLTLEVRPASIKLTELPASLTLVANVRGLHGEALDGAPVTFSISVPGQATATYQATSRQGVALWRDFRVPETGTQAGQGLATAMVVLAEGQLDELVLQESATIRIR